MSDPSNDRADLDEFMQREIARHERRQKLLAAYPTDTKMTFFSPDAHPDDLGNVCPICRRRTPTSARYVNYICEPCTERALTENGELIEFGNVGLSGGLSARLRHTRQEVATSSCIIDGQRCRVDEARFGGVVYRRQDHAADASEHASRAGNRAAQRVAGAVLGAAVGDALGHPTEFMRSTAQIRARFGPRGVEGFVLFWERDGRRFAPYTDDTQLAEIVLSCAIDSVLAHEPLDTAMARLGGAFVSWARAPQGGHRAPGRACLAGAAQLAGGARWDSAGAPDAGGCGSVMRAYPLGLVFHADAERREQWAVAQSKLTHGAPIALAACAAMAHATASALAGDPVSATIREMVESAGRYDRGTADGITRAAQRAEAGEDPASVLQDLQGWAAHEAIAAATYVYVRHADDFSAAVLEGANSPGDSDSIATLAGALVGARCGIHAIPPDWIRDVERSDELCQLAERTRLSSGYPDWDLLAKQLEENERDQD